MKLLFAGKNERGISCLSVVNKYHEVIGLITDIKSDSDSIVQEAKKLKIKVYQTDDVNNANCIKDFRGLKPEIIVLAGFSQIVKQEFIELAPKGCINLHAGKLPKYRGSSPLNWALINGDKNFTISIINVDTGVDSGDILIERSFNINENTTIRDLHSKVNEEFPGLLLQILTEFENGKQKVKKQDKSQSSYFPLRFPDDGLVFFDQLTAEEIHNRVRALTDPYPGAYSYYQDCKIKILKSSFTKNPFYGESGRIYRISSEKGLLVCARDKCLWLNKIINYNTGENCMSLFKRYDKLATIKYTVARYYENC